MYQCYDGGGLYQWYGTHLISSNTSGLSFSLSFIRSFIAMMIVFALSSAPCFELFSAAPAENNLKTFKRNCQTLLFQIQSLTDFKSLTGRVADRGAKNIALRIVAEEQNRIYFGQIWKVSIPSSPNGDLPVEPFLLAHFYTWDGTNSKV